MLFIKDYQAEAGKMDVVTKQGVGADGNVRGAGSDGANRKSTLGRTVVAEKSYHLHLTAL